MRHRRSSRRRCRRKSSRRRNSIVRKNKNRASRTKSRPRKYGVARMEICGNMNLHVCTNCGQKNSDLNSEGVCGYCRKCKRCGKEALCDKIMRHCPDCYRIRKMCRLCKNDSESLKYFECKPCRQTPRPIRRQKAEILPAASRSSSSNTTNTCYWVWWRL